MAFKWFLESQIEQTENLSGLLTAEIETEVLLNTSGHTALTRFGKMTDAICSVVCSMSSGAKLPKEEFDTIQNVTDLFPSEYTLYQEAMETRETLVKAILKEIGATDVLVNELPLCDFIFSDELKIEEPALQEWFSLMTSLSAARTNALLYFKMALEKYHALVVSLNDGSVFSTADMKSANWSYEQALVKRHEYEVLRLKERVYCTEIGFSSIVPIEG